jgi:hypothetical protein
MPFLKFSTELIIDNKTSSKSFNIFYLEYSIQRKIYL